MFGFGLVLAFLDCSTLAASHGLKWPGQLPWYRCPGHSR
jgi:hypothetical protein